MKFGKFRLKNRTLFIIIGAAAFLIIAYFIAIPTAVAYSYLNQINAKTAQAKADLKAVAAGPNVVVFENPDIKLAQRRPLIEQARASVQRAQKSLSAVSQANTLPKIPGNGFAGRYHRAMVRKERTDNAIRQSREVLDEYSAALTYVDAYTEPQLYLERQLDYINGIQDFATIAGQGSNMAAIAAHLHTGGHQLAALTPPPAFTPLHTEALQSLNLAATSFEQLSHGLNRASDTDVYSAVASLETIALKNDVDDKELLTNIAQSSPTIEQLGELTEKIENSEQY